TEEGEERRVWHALVTQQATSGFRQIFVSDGRLVVTRLTQRPPGELSAGAVALLIERELRSSISYIKRLGYTDFDRLDLVVLADPEVCAAVESRELPVTTLTAHTPRQAGEILDYGEVGPEDSPYSDVLHAACLAAKRRPIVVLPTEKFRDRSNTDRAFRAGFVSAAALTLFTLLYVGSLLFDAYDTQTEADVLTAQMATEQQALDLARNKVKGFAIPLDDLLLVGQSEESFAKHQINPTNLLRSLAGTLEPSYRLVRLTYAVPAPQQANSGGATPVKRGFPGFGGDNKKEAETLFELRFTVRFSGDRSQPELIIQQAKDLKDRLARAMPDHEVSVVQLPLNQMRNQVLEGNTAVGLPTGIPTADYLVRKRL
ncbi:MAG TPA: hypothetical protein HPP80_08395, partial [Rhodospirillaceae bacterium]|nr:hypothetical protein [Rhodospirillaceae bacterium]